MDSYVRGFVKASLIWLGVGVLLGLSFVFWPSHIVYRPAHVHANLFGFVSMMIFGVAYHVMPRFTGTPLHHPRLAMAHLWVGNAGLALMVAGFIVRVHWLTPGSLALQTGTVLATTGVAFFIYNIWRTLSPARAAAGAARITNLRSQQGGIR